MGPRLLCARSATLILTGIWQFFPGMASGADTARKPNILFILADDLGYGDLGCYGQKRIRTPHVDALAAQGLRFTQFYAGSTVCAPSRCCLMTGRHTGHARVRGNALVPLQPGDLTVAEVLHQSGYVTGLIGKWGLGEAGSTGVPNRKGFDTFFGYLNQVHAHNYYPDFLWSNDKKVPIPQNVVKDGVASPAVVYAPDLMLREALRFLDDNRDRPFFLYFASTIPHANNERGNAQGNGMETPSDRPYTNEPWPQAEKNYAAMVTRLDADVGALLKRLDELKLGRDTVVFFTSDNGPHREGGSDPAFFGSAGPLCGIKRDLTEGGIRVPMVVRWLGRVPAGVSDRVWTFWDFLPTAATIAGAPPVEGVDGLSVLPVLEGKALTTRHEYLYWEFHEGGSKQAVRMGDWKAIRDRPGGPLRLYDLANDLGETKNVADRHPDVVAKVEQYLKTARTESEAWPLRDAPKKKAR